MLQNQVVLVHANVGLSQVLNLIEISSIENYKFGVRLHFWPLGSDLFAQHCCKRVARVKVK